MCIVVEQWETRLAQYTCTVASLFEQPMSSKWITAGGATVLKSIRSCRNRGVLNHIVSNSPCFIVNKIFPKYCTGHKIVNYSMLKGIITPTHSRFKLGQLAKESLAKFWKVLLKGLKPAGWVMGICQTRKPRSQ